MDLYRKLRKMKILLIDDDEWIRDSLAMFMEAEGCHLKACESAEEALDAINRQPYDIIIADYRLPGMNGLEFLKKIAVSRPQAIRILMTAYSNEGIVSEAGRVGIQDLIEKPFTTRTIEKSLSRLVEKVS
jgi:DNA-binding NtrC family response regulator